MVLNRLGNKSRIAQDIIKHFPPHRTYIDMFFGAGGIFFNKPLADYNFCNDLDNDVFNLWTVFQSDKDELFRQLELMPVHETLLKHWNNNQEDDPIQKAVRFLKLSNFGYMGKPETLRFGQTYGNPKRSIMSKVESSFKFLAYAQFMCQDFREVLSKIQFRGNKQDAFIYADPPYLSTTNNYSQGFEEKDTIDLFKVLVNSGICFALSEFDNPVVLQLASKYGLNIINVGERANMKNRRLEILVTNYKNRQRSLFDCI